MLESILNRYNMGYNLFNIHIHYIMVTVSKSCNSIDILRMRFLFHHLAHTVYLVNKLCL